MRTDGLCLLYIPGGCLLTALGADKVITNNVQIAAPLCDNCAESVRLCAREWEAEKERERESEWRWGMRKEEGDCAMGASFQVSQTTSGDGFKPNSLPPINIQAEREYINCLTITHFEKREENRRRRKKKRYWHCFFIIHQNYKQKLK